MAILVLVLLVVGAELVTSGEDPTPSWAYKCVRNLGCQRIQEPSSTISPKIFDSLDACRIVCGPHGGLWPRPFTTSLGSETVNIHPQYIRYDLSLVPEAAKSLMAEMTKVISANLLAECGGKVTKVVTTPVVVYITVKSYNVSLTWDTDEEYSLNVQTKDGQVTVVVIGETIYGVRHGLESFTQLVAPDTQEYDKHEECGLRLVSEAKIRDYPAFKHRGFVLDTSRNFIPMKDIKRTIDGLAASKMNVFHWHVTDSHSFPLESVRVPQFTRYGAYSKAEIYSAKEVKNLVMYAQIRGVRLVIEIDAPAHAGNGWQWGNDYGYGDLAVCVNAQPWRNLCIQPPCGQLNPANKVMYRVLRNLYRDIAEVLPKPALFHMGGDEIVFSCWNSSQDIQSYMIKKGFSLDHEGFIRLWAEFHSKALKLWDEELVASHAAGNQPVMIWSSDLTQAQRIQKYLSKDRYVIEVWEPVNSPLLYDLRKLGYRVVSVPKDVWYLDHGFWGTTKYANWRRMYEHMLPRDPGVLGGEVAMWSEYIDANVLDTRVWPRTAAVAERLWSDPSTSADAAEPRLQRLRNRLTARGLRPDVLSPAWCTQHDGRCHP